MLTAGDIAPEFRLRDADSKPVALDDLLAGGPVLLAFLKVSCPVCQYTFPYLQRLASGAGLPVLGISQDDPESTAWFRQAFGISFSVAFDGRGYPVSNAYRITHVPSLFLVEPDRKISMSASGFSRRDLQALGERFGASPFREGERVPDFKPG